MDIKDIEQYYFVDKDKQGYILDEQNQYMKQKAFRQKNEVKEIKVGYFKEYHGQIYFSGVRSQERHRDLFTIACSLCYGVSEIGLQARNFIAIATETLLPMWKKYTKDLFLFTDILSVAFDIKQEMKELMSSNLPPPNTKSQAKHKQLKESAGYGKTLIDTGLLINSIKVKIIFKDGSALYI